MTNTGRENGNSRIADSRRTAARIVLLFVFGLGLVTNMGAHATSATRPNVLLILIDDLNDYVGALGGHPQAWTPNIDILANQGSSFTNAHAAVPQCHAARVSLLTGISPARSGIRSNRDRPWRSFLPEAVSLPQAFRRAGYRTAAYGKIFHYNDADHWDEFQVRVGGSPKPSTGQIPLNGLQGVGNINDWGPIDKNESKWKEYKLATKVIDYINNRDPNESKPFLVAYGTYAPHTPWYVPRAHFDKIAGGNTDAIVVPRRKIDDLNDVGKVARVGARVNHWRPIVDSPHQIRAAVHNYLAAVAMVDRQVGRILSALDNSPHATDTVVVLVSDHGLHLSEKQSWGKLKLWEEDTRVPLIIRVPQRVLEHQPRQISRAVSISAIFPTLLELAGIPLPNYAANDRKHRIDYRSLVPLLRDPMGAPWGGPAATFGFKAARNVSLRTDRYRFTVYRDGFTELYDHLSDPDEWDNVVDLAAHRTRVSAWLRDAARYLDADHRPFGTPDTMPDPDTGTVRLGDYVWHDIDGDGIQDAAEPGLAGVTVRLQDCNGNVLRTTSSGANGAYSFAGLTPGRYKVRFIEPDGFTLTARMRGNRKGRDSDPFPASGLSSCLTISDGKVRLGIDAGMR